MMGRITVNCLLHLCLLLSWWSIDYFAVRGGVSYSMVENMSLMRRTIFPLQLRFRTGVVLVLGLLQLTRGSFNTLTLSLAVTTFQAASRRLSMGWLVATGVWTARQWFNNIVIRLYSIDLVLCRECSTLFLLFHGGICLRLTHVAIGAMNVLKINNFDCLSMAA